MDLEQQLTSARQAFVRAGKQLVSTVMSVLVVAIAMSGASVVTSLSGGALDTVLPVAAAAIGVLVLGTVASVALWVRYRLAVRLLHRRTVAKAIRDIDRLGRD
jgi:hypothetical protein